MQIKNKYQKALEMILKQKYEDLSEFMYCVSTLQELILIAHKHGIVEDKIDENEQAC